MSDSPAHEPAGIAAAAAAFLVQALQLADQPESIANELAALKRDANATIFTVQLDSSVGLATFLIYSYVLDTRGGDGHTGQELYDLGLETLSQAAERNTPGPRTLASGTTEQFGFILATTPGTYRALTGTARPSAASTPDTTPEASDERRARAADALLGLLRQANDQATIWLSAIQSATAQSDGDADHAMVSFSQEETELALFLLDDDSIGNLLRSMNLLVATAQEQAAQAMASPADAELPDLPDYPETPPPTDR